MKIILKIDGKEKTFTTDFVSARRLRRTLEISKKIGKALTPEDLDELVDYEVELYGRQFTSDDLYDGIESSEIIQKCLEDINTVIASMNKKMDAISEKN